MQADIHGKFVSEDVLTGHVFGVLRYTSRFGAVLGPILKAVRFEASNESRRDVESVLDALQQDPVVVDFWAHRDAEIDVVLRQKEVLFAIEVKEQSWLSNAPDAENQLARYARLLPGKYPDFKGNIWMILLAPQDKAMEIFEASKKHFSETEQDKLAYLTWESLYDELEKLQPGLAHPDSLIVADLIQYLKTKGYNSFTEFPLKDYISYKIFSQSYEFY